MSSSSSAAAPGPERHAGQAQPAPDERGLDESPAGRPASVSPPDAPPPGAERPRTVSDSHADFLITSDERDAAEARLRQAVADEVLSLEEFGDRMRLLLEARTRADLHAAVAGLPIGREPRTRTAQRGHARPARRGGSAYAILSGAETRGRWQPEDSTTAVAVMGESVIDLQGVEFEGDELVISAFAVLGEVVIVVPEGVPVDMRGVAVMGDRVVKVDDAALPGAPVVRIDGLALMGQITVRHPTPRERFVPTDGRGAFADRVPLQEADAATMRPERRRTPLARVRRRGAGILAAVALALPLGWVLSADDVAGAVFGSASRTVSAAELEAGDVSVGAPVAFGSVDIQVPEGVNVDRDGVVVFGSTSCEPECAVTAADAPTVQVRAFGAFGSVEITQVPRSGTD
jgi:hypothetical protein